MQHKKTFLFFLSFSSSISSHFEELMLPSQTEIHFNSIVSLHVPTSWTLAAMSMDNDYFNEHQMNPLLPHALEIWCAQEFAGRVVVLSQMKIFMWGKGQEWQMKQLLRVGRDIERRSSN
jgi:hypothetical protein